MPARLILILSLFSAVVYASETMYIQSASAKMFSDKSLSSELLAEIPKGQSVLMTAASGRWSQVTYQNKSGWISSLLLSKNPPLDKVTVITDDTSLGDNTRRRASAVATAGATRGLTSDSRQRLNEDGESNRRAVLQLEQTKISETELIQFREGLLK